MKQSIKEATKKYAEAEINKKLGMTQEQIEAEFEERKSGN